MSDMYRIDRSRYRFYTYSYSYTCRKNLSCRIFQNIIRRAKSGNKQKIVSSGKSWYKRTSDISKPIEGQI